MLSLSVTVGHWDIFLLVLVRVAAMVMVAPVLGGRPVPAQVKIGLSLLLAILLAPMQDVAGPVFTDLFSIVVSVAGEVVMGLLLGFSATLLFSAVQMAAQIIGVQIGFSFSNTLDPLSSQGSGFMETLYNMMAVVVFLSLGGHHALIAGLAQSFDAVPVGRFTLAPVLGDRLVALSAVAFGTGLRLALPVVGTMMLVDCAMALVVRAIPQMNVFAVGLPVKMVVGFLTLVALTPLTVSGVGSLANGVVAGMARMLQ